MLNKRLYRSLLFFLTLLTFSIAMNAAEEKIQVSEGWKSFQVRSTAPIPSEVTNETQSRALSREAAISAGQAALLTVVLQKRTHSKKTLAEAEIPSLDLQGRIRGTIKGARVVKTVWINKECTVTLVLDKSHIKDILRKN